MAESNEWTQDQEPEEPAAERPAGPEGEVAPEPALEVETPAERIATLEAKSAELKDQLLRALAETENTRRRMRKETEDTAKYAVAKLAKDLLAAPDNLRRALDAIPSEGRQGDALLDRLAEGVELVEREMLAIFERHGVRRIEPLGVAFDHNFHQALFEVATADQPPGTVVQVLAPGYVIHDRLLRPAMVAVAKAPAANDAGEGPETGGETPA